jgi:hypothetical protein
MDDDIQKNMVDEDDFYPVLGGWLQAFNPNAAPLVDGRTKRADEKVWVASDGRRIPYKDLDGKHLTNLLLYLRRTTLEAAEEETAKQGVQVSSEEAWKQVEPPEWTGLLAEAVSRGGIMEALAGRINEGMNEALIRSLVQI